MAGRIESHLERLKRTSLRRNLVVSVLPAAGIVVVLSLLSAMSSIITIFDSADYPFMGFGIGSLTNLWLLPVGIVTGGLVVFTVMYVRLFSNDMYEALSEPWIGRERRWAHIIFYFFIGALLIPFLLQLAAHSSLANANDIARMFAKFVRYSERYTGGMVGFALAVITVLGFYLTIQQLNDFQRRITSFPELLERITLMARSADTDDKMHIISYTPAIGYLAQQKKWTAFYNALVKKGEGGLLAEGSRARILTQNMDSLKQWHNQFLNRKTKRHGGERLGCKDIDDANDAAQRIKDAFDSDSYVEVDYNLLPGYYCFFTCSRAIIVAPLFLPLTPTQGGPAHDPTFRPPHMIGFETTDRGVIDSLFEQFDYIEQCARAPAKQQNVAAE